MAAPTPWAEPSPLADIDTVSVVAVAVLAGPATLWLVRRTQHRSRRWRSSEQVMVIAGTGLLAAATTTLGERGYGLLALVVLGGAAAIIDVVELRLPDLLTGSLAAATALLVVVDGLLVRSVGGVVRAVLTAACVCAVALLAKLIRTAVLGWGDAKFMVSLTGLLGWWSETSVLTGVIFWAALVLITSAIVAASPRMRRQDVPYGPALLLGTLAAFFATG
jgi:prepilin signal peptidase PulO-like enzyme (type II secretory pathway)